MEKDDKIKLIIKHFETNANTYQISRTIGLEERFIIESIRNYYNCDNIADAKKIVSLLGKANCRFNDVIRIFEQTLKAKEVEAQLGINRPLLTKILMLYYQCDSIPDAKAKILNRKGISNASDNGCMTRYVEKEVIELFEHDTCYDQIVEKLSLSPFYIKKLILNHYNCSSLVEAKKIIDEKKMHDTELVERIIQVFKSVGTIDGTSEQTGLSNNDVKKIILNFSGCSSIPQAKFKLKSNTIVEKDIINKIVSVFKNVGSISKTAEQTGLPDKFVKQIILDFYKCDSIEIARKRSGAKKELSVEMKEHFKNVHLLYLELGSLEKVATKLNITRERVRQLLNKGEQYGLFHYITYNEQRFEQLKQQVDKSFLEEILVENTKNEILELLNISDNDFKKLINFFDIDYKELNEEFLKRKKNDEKNKCISEYCSIVEKLGDHPSTTFLSRNKQYNNLWSKINRFWGNINEFRKELSINNIQYERGNVEYCIKNKEERKQLKEYNKSLVFEIIKKIQPVNIKSIYKLMNNLSNGTINNYITELLENESIVKTYNGRLVYYVINSDFKNH